ncbi:uncharacterized protein J4E84_001483 [Alternaria hordeiaustralica]|uniref:uncharacterized protein n=1 Tax=Alternaria hordeiaustralica TaxID=1187925 RepID=UPI0020C34116|nr:uncharacterized protein J4E84_001483 [Alternaria hordeiaustralica]KAI4698347.1 hypothetical protein J4E84_001483 [Alternaria hordeiaustralica]
MVDKIGRPRKAVGSNDPSGKGDSAPRGRQQREASSHKSQYYSAHDGFEDAPMLSALSASQHRDFEEAQAEPEPRARPANIRTSTAAESQIDAEEDETPSQPASPSSSSSSSWEDLPSPQSTSLPTATPFPGTWPAALHDTSAALSEVSTATISFASALASSGLGRASWSIGAATLSSTNRAALSFTTWGMEKTGVMPNELPRPMRRWIQGKEERDRRRRQAEQRRRERRRRERDGVVITGGVDEEGGYVLATHEMDGTLNFEGRGPLDMREETSEQEEVQEHATGQEEIKEQEDDHGEDGLMRVFEFDDDEDL